jgi:phosphoribosyl 1,2-cyclic phosphodiesterase
VRVTIWGCRGSVPTPGPATVTYGGNTSCVEVLLDDGSVVVLDAGTGIIGLGADLQRREVRRLHVLLTHLHLDHLEGLRFFAPLWDPRVTVDVWGPPSPVQALQQRIARSFSPPLFPIDIRVIPASVTFRDVPREPWTLEGVSLTAALVVHPGPTVAFRLETPRSCFADVPDHEPALAGFRGRPADWISGAPVAQGADLLFHDAQFSEEEYGSRVGWGHSSVDDAVAYARIVEARRLVLFHHDPGHDDAELERLEAHARSVAGDGLDPTLGREGMVFELG